MEEHKNATQIAIIIDFMEQHSDIAKGFTRRDVADVESLWQELAASLNAAGPPTKDVVGWKKEWMEWKSDVKKKLAHNKVKVRSTDFGSYCKHHLSQTEETIVRICGILQAVEGIPGVSIGLNEDALVEAEHALDESDDDCSCLSTFCVELFG